MSQVKKNLNEQGGNHFRKKYFVYLKNRIQNTKMLFHAGIFSKFLVENNNNNL